MKKLALNSRNILYKVSNLEKKHKIVTYASLLFLTISTYFLRTENQNVKIKYATLQERSKGLKENMVIFNRNYEGFPLPVWQKVKRGKHFITQYVNPSYTSKFGHLFSYDTYAHIGKNNFDLFDKKHAQEYYEKDMAVAVTGEILHSKDGFINVDGKKAFMEVVKWRQIENNKDTLIYGMVKQFIEDSN
ncbi:hypothetical protein [Polaribacter sp. M15]